jgi:hypothetical protein
LVSFGAATSHRTTPDAFEERLSLVLDRVNAFRRPSRRVTARAEIIVVDVDVIGVVIIIFL